MAKKEKKEAKIVLERAYTIPLRKEFQKAPPYRRAKKAVSAVRSFISRHMKSDNVIIGNYLNLALWKNGIKNPPHKIKVEAKKDEKGIVKVEVVGAPKEELKPKEEKKKLKKKIEEKIAKPAEIKEEEKKEPDETGIGEKVGERKEVQKEEARKIEKEELKEIKKEKPKVHTPKVLAKQPAAKSRDKIPGR